MTRYVVLGALLLIASCSRPGSEAGQNSVRATTPRASTKANEAAQLLDALGYAEWGAVEPARAHATAGVTLHEGAAEVGWNLYKSGPRHRALLMDMKGEIVHSWEQAETTGRSWHHVELGPSGDLYALVKTRLVEKLDSNSELIWRTEVQAHHDLAVDPAGGVLVLTESVRTLELHGLPCPIVDNGVAKLSPDGERLEQFQLSSLFADRIPQQRVEDIRRHVQGQPDRIHRKAELLDVFHANSIEILDRDVWMLSLVQGRSDVW